MLELISFLDTNLPLTDDELLHMSEAHYSDLPALYFRETDFVWVLIEPHRFVELWCYPEYNIGEYDFCPDRRIRTHRLFGKPSLGLSPPCIKVNSFFNCSFVINQVNLN
jgi:hypothetical protein